MKRRSTAALMLSSYLFFFPHVDTWALDHHSETDTVPASDNWNTLWEEAQEEAAQQDRDTRSQAEKLKGFDKNFHTVDHPLFEPLNDNFTFSFLPFSSIEEHLLQHSSKRTFSFDINKTINNDRFNSFQQTWEDFGAAFSDTYDQQQQDTFERDEAFDSQTGVYERVNE
ncbi:hypothetical protein SAMN05192534_11126 [Alteribacillus persepolensis]|uniref:Uncharacterized protein n=1 Tax=Alteribacillus persepolensis TaxID=568899 RepID=A0A1G8F3Q4_9BACI|nr:hypothetical protein [Alteribacillus persepolensis]SDH76775.1 hypothetical protein SAMN05192534_11126 [Alteribacillus persepolensis]